MKTSKTLTRRFLNVIFISVMANMLLSLGLIAVAGTFRRAETGIYEDFAYQINKEADTLNQLLNKHSTSAIITANNIDNRIKTLSQITDTNVSELYRSEELARTALGFALSSLTVGFDINNVFGFFFIMRDDERGPVSGYPGVYIEEAKDRSDGGSYVYVRGPIELTATSGIPLGGKWRRNIDLSDSLHPFYKKLTEKEFDHTIALREDGYWSEPTDMLNTGVMSISYSVPLIDDNGRVYAILGLILETDELVGRLGNPENSKYGTAYYASGKDETSFGWTISGKNLLDIDDSIIGSLENKKLLSVTKSGGRIEEFEITENDKKKKLISYSKELGVIGNTRYGSAGDWALTGFTEKSIVLESYYNMLIQVISSVFLAVLGAGFLIYVLAKNYFDRISGLSRMVRIEAPGLSPAPGKANIDEIDYIADAFEDMRRSVSESSLRIATILDLLQMPIGSFEVRKKDVTRVFVTPSLKDMLSIEGSGKSMYMDPDSWSEIYSRLKSKPCDHDENIYCWYPESGKKGIKYFKVDEMEGETTTIGVLMDVTDQMLKNMDLAYRASYDDLTGLHNRQAFKRKAIAEVRHRPDDVGVMIFGDLDGLKKINDVYGHSKGDLIIQRAGEMMGTFEYMGGIVSRLSGDEFAAFIHGFKSREEALKSVYDNMSLNFSRTVTIAEGVDVPVSISRGIALYPHDSDDFSTLLSLADYTMYQAKFAQKGSIRTFDKDGYLNDKVSRRKIEALERIIDERSMQYTFQPIYDIKAMKLAGYAVYMMPRDGELNNPKSVLDTAIISGIHGGLEKMIFGDILEWMQKESLDKKIMLCVKTIKNYILDREELEAFYEKYRALFSQLMIMIPADSTLDESINKKKTLMFREHNTRIAFDGIGEDLDESFNMLRLKPDMVKIDIGHIRSASSNLQSKMKLDNIMAMCRQHNIAMLAAQVETKIDYEMARRFDFDMVQGYYIGYPQDTLTDPGIQTS